jgi:ubiquinone/menaquinone biosynthesis C-methylase UbiE
LEKPHRNRINFHQPDLSFHKLSSIGNMMTVMSIKSIDKVEYGLGKGGFQEVSTYDQKRYLGRANEYKQKVMANAYGRLIGPLAGKQVLDVGCGTGRGLTSFSAEARFAMGCDASLDMLSFARKKVTGRQNCSFSVAYAQHLPFPQNSFDVVAALNFLHLFSVETQKAMIAEMKRVLKPGGILVLEFDNALQGVGLGLYKRWFRDEHGSLPGEIRNALGDQLKVVGIYGAVFPIIWRWLHHFPTAAMPIEKLAYFAPLNRLAQRIYYKAIKL